MQMSFYFINNNNNNNNNNNTSDHYRHQGTHVYSIIKIITLVIITIIIIIIIIINSQLSIASVKFELKTFFYIEFLAQSVLLVGFY